MTAQATTGTVTGWGALRSMSLTATVDAIRNVVASPGANQTLTLLVVSCVVLAVLLLVVFAVMLLTPSRKKVVKVRRYYGPDAAARAAAARAAAASSATAPPGRVSRALTSSAAIATLVVLAFVGTYAATSTDFYCAQTCHTSTVASATGLDADHAPCVSCHEDGLLNVFANAGSRARMLVRYSAGVTPASSEQAVDSAACLRCHRSVRAGAVTSERTGVRMSHTEVLEGGIPCSRCHAGTGHADTAFSASMSACVPCHDTTTASAACATCHTKDPSALAIGAVGAPDEGRALGTGKLTYPAVRAAKRNCGGCHDQERQCDTCHGIRMPHSTAFKAGAHARNAAFELKRVCWRCHDPQWCGSTGCHRSAFNPVTGDTAHGAGWKQDHARAAWDAGCVCHSQRGYRGRDVPICRLCHAADRSLLPLQP